MSEVLELRGLNEIESRRLVWEKSLGESRWRHFSMQWDYYRQAVRWTADQWEPLVLEARWDDRILGMLPLLAHRKFQRWVSPNLVTGIGPAMMLGREITAAWMQIANHLKRRSLQQGTLDLGPFDPRVGVAARLETAFANIASRRLAKLKITQLEFDTTLKLWNEGPRPKNRIELISSHSQSRYDHGLPEREHQTLLAAIESPDAQRISPVKAISQHANVAIDAIENLAAAGLIWVSHIKSSERAIRRIVWVGDLEQVSPLFEIRHAGESDMSADEAAATLTEFHAAGVKRVCIQGIAWPKISNSLPIDFRTYGFANRLDVRNAWHVLWNPLKIATPVLR